jgi:hypothetical protein
MNKNLSQNYKTTLEEDQKTIKRMEMALKKSKELDQTENMNLSSKTFKFDDCKNEMWNPENYSLLYGTWLWNHSTPEQKVRLNQLYWIAYYSQIISAEIATIFFNQTAAAAMYGMEDFRIVCDTLDLESSQERAHIHTFKTVSEKFEEEVFGERIFTYPMRTPFVKTMLYSDLTEIQRWIRTWQLRTYSLLSSNSAFIGCQYFTVRGLRTLNGKIIQHHLSRYYTHHENKELAPIPSKISYYHFIDVSFHFNTSTLISHDIINSLLPPTKFEKFVANMSLEGCQKDHYNFSTAINGIFWYDPALYPAVYKILKSKVFGMDHEEAMLAIKKSFCEESEGMIQSHSTHLESVDSYKNYLADFNYINKTNKDMTIISKNNREKHLQTNTVEFNKFYRNFKMKAG